jgi:hypothetical protein
MQEEHKTSKSYLLENGHQLFYQLAHDLPLETLVCRDQNILSELLCVSYTLTRDDRITELFSVYTLPVHGPSERGCTFCEFPS